MQQVTSSSDIWSVGCLIVELLTGSPPYYDLITMAAMFRIVQVRTCAAPVCARHCRDPAALALCVTLPAGLRAQ